MSGGGSGSTHIIRTMRKQHKVIARPDRCLELNGKGGVVSTYSWDMNITQNMADLFNERSDVKVSLPCTVMEMFKTLIENTSKNIVFGGNICQLGEGGNWATWCDPVFFIRHPLHNYISWFGHQHKEMQINGDICSVESMTRFAKYWNNVVSYARNGRIVRYEYAKKDATGANVPAWIFKGLKSKKRNNGVLPKDKEDVLKSLCQYKDVYDRWDV